MRSISVREMRTVLPRIEELLAEAGEVLITRHGKPVARVLPTVPQGGFHLGRACAGACVASQSAAKC